MTSSRIQRQLQGQRIEPRTLQSQKQNTPHIHEFTYGPAMSFTLIPFVGSYVMRFFKYISLPAPMKLYSARIKATYYSPAAAPPGTALSVYAALYNCKSKDPVDTIDMTGGNPDELPIFNLVDYSSDTYSPTYFDSSAASPSLSVIPSNWGSFYFTKEPMLIPGNDYYLCFTVTGASAASAGFWSDSSGPIISASGGNGWARIETGTPEIRPPLTVSPTARGFATPAVILNSKHGIHRSGYRIG